MCTAATYQTKDFYMGRTLDYEFSYGEKVTITPRNYPFHFRHMGDCPSHYAMIGMAHVAGDYPLYYDAVNEKGLGIAGLNFVGNAYFGEVEEGKDNIAQFEVIPYLLASCASVREVREALAHAKIVGTAFHPDMPASSLHWMIADSKEAITVESEKDGLHIYENPVGVLTNNPPFPQQMFELNRYRQLSPKQPKQSFLPNLHLQEYSRGMGAIGLPGDLSSSSRFVRAVFTKSNAISGEGEEESVGQFYHILGAVEQQRGCCEVAPDKYEITIYTSCWNATQGIYYYTTYENRRITAVDMHHENLDEKSLVCYPLIEGQHIYRQN